MQFTDFFIKRPIITVVLTLTILLAGFQSIHVLNIRQYPRSDIAVIVITTHYIGANAELVCGYLTTPLEKAIAAREGIDYIESSSTQGTSTIIVHLRLNYNANEALTQIQAKLGKIRNDLPPEAETPTIELKNADERLASLYLGFTAPNMQANQITDYLTRVIQPTLTAIEGVQRADILGPRVIAMRIWLKPDRLEALGISASDVRKALVANNYLSALGTTKGTMTAINLTSNTQLTTTEEFKKLVIKEKNGVLVFLKDVADVEMGAEDYNDDAKFDGKNAKFMGIWCLPTANTLDVCKKVRDLLPEIRKLLLPGMMLAIPYDSTDFIKEAIHEVLKTLMETLFIVIIVIFLFLGSLPAVMIPVATIPISLIGVAFIMRCCGFSINLLSLLGIVLSVGLVVDDSIVIVENVERYIHEGLSSLNAALRTGRDLCGPIIAMTITLAVVYTPLAIQGGLTGALFREFAFTVAGAVIISGIVAITLSPMMAAYLLRYSDNNHGYAAWVNKIFSLFQAQYRNILASCLHHRGAILIIAGLCILIMPAFYFLSPKELAPKEDQGIVYTIYQASPFSTIDQTLIYAKMAQKICMQVPEAQHVFQVMHPSDGFGGITTIPWHQRKRSCANIATDLGIKTSRIPGLQVVTTTPPALPGGSNFPVEFIIASTFQPQQLLATATDLVKTLYASGIVMYADSDLKYDQPQVEIIFDHNKLSSLGLNLQQVASDLGIMLGGNYVNRFNIQGTSYKVIPELKRLYRPAPESLAKIYITGPNGQLIQLSTFAKMKWTSQPRAINRFQQLNSVKIFAVIPPVITIDQVLKVLEKRASEILPRGFVIDYAGESRQLRHEGNSLIITMLFSCILIFLLLTAQFESFRDPFIILLGSVPLALSGALLFSFLGATTINIYSQIGLITLVGLIVKNGILIVQFANSLQKNGLDKWHSILEGASTRLRPILMTTVATVVGHTPLIFASGPGAAARHSIGIMLVSGMLIGTLITLFLLPALYLCIAKNKNMHIVNT